jgi:hypothetical protein
VIKDLNFIIEPVWLSFSNAKLLETQGWLSFSNAKLLETRGWLSFPNAKLLETTLGLIIVWNEQYEQKMQFDKFKSNEIEVKITSKCT